MSKDTSSSSRRSSRRLSLQEFSDLSSPISSGRTLLERKSDEQLSESSPPHSLPSDTLSSEYPQYPKTKQRNLYDRLQHSPPDPNQDESTHGDVSASSYSPLKVKRKKGGLKKKSGDPDIRIPEGTRRGIYRVLDSPHRKLLISSRPVCSRTACLPNDVLNLSSNFNKLVGEGDDHKKNCRDCCPRSKHETEWDYASRYTASPAAKLAPRGVPEEPRRVYEEIPRRSSIYDETSRRIDREGTPHRSTREETTQAIVHQEPPRNIPREEAPGPSDQKETSDHIARKETPDHIADKDTQGHIAPKETADRIVREESLSHIPREETPKHTVYKEAPHHFVGEDTIRYIAHHDNLRRIAHKEKPRNITHKDTPRRTTREETARRVTREETASRVTREETPRPGSREDTQRRISRADTPRRTSREKTPRHITPKEAPHHIVREKAPHNIVHEETSRHVIHEETSHRVVRGEPPRRATLEETPRRETREEPPRRATLEETPRLLNRAETRRQIFSGETSHRSTREETSHRFTREENLSETVISVSEPKFPNQIGSSARIALLNSTCIDSRTGATVSLEGARYSITQSKTGAIPKDRRKLEERRKSKDRINLKPRHIAFDLPPEFDESSDGIFGRHYESATQPFLEPFPSPYVPEPPFWDLPSSSLSPPSTRRQSKDSRDSSSSRHLSFDPFDVQYVHRASPCSIEQETEQLQQEALVEALEEEAGCEAAGGEPAGEETVEEEPSVSISAHDKTVWRELQWEEYEDIDPGEILEDEGNISMGNMGEMSEQERKITLEFCHLLEKSKQLFNGLRELPQYGHKQWHSYFGRTFDVYTKLWKFQQQHRCILDTRYGLKRWQIGEIASKIGQLYYHFYLRTSETAYLSEAFAFYSAIRGRSYYTKASKEDRCELMVKKLRYYARFIVVCLLLRKLKLVRELIKELDRQIIEYGNTYDPDDQAEWNVVVDEVKAFIQAEPVVTVLHPDNYPVILTHRLNTLITPPVERMPQMTLSLQEVIIVGSTSLQVKFSELTMDMFRMLQTLEREPTGEIQQMFDDSPRQKFNTTPSAINNKGYNLDNGPRNENPHKFLLFKPTPAQILVYLASGCNDLPPHGALLLYISADGHILPASKHPEDVAYDSGGLITISKNEGYRDSAKEPKSSSPKLRECLYPGDLYPFTRRPLFMILESDNSFGFQYIPRHFGQPLLILMSPMEVPISLHVLGAERRQGSLFTLFLHSPLSALCLICDVPSLSLVHWERAQTYVDSFMVEASQLMTRARIDPTYLAFMGDDFLRLLILRYIFCEVVLRMHRSFRARSHLPRASPPLPEDLLDHPVLIHIVSDLISHLQVRGLFQDPTVAGPPPSKE